MMGGADKHRKKKSKGDGKGRKGSKQKKEGNIVLVQEVEPKGKGGKFSKKKRKNNSAEIVEIANKMKKERQNHDKFRKKKSKGTENGKKKDKKHRDPSGAKKRTKKSPKGTQDKEKKEQPAFGVPGDDILDPNAGKKKNDESLKKEEKSIKTLMKTLENRAKEERRKRRSNENTASMTDTCKLPVPPQLQSGKEKKEGQEQVKERPTQESTSGKGPKATDRSSRSHGKEAQPDRSDTLQQHVSPTEGANTEQQAAQQQQQQQAPYPAGGAPLDDGFSLSARARQLKMSYGQKKPKDLELNMDEILRIGAVLERYGMPTDKKKSFDWLAMNRNSGDSDLLAANLALAIGDLVINRQLCRDVVLTLEKYGVLDHQETLNLWNILVKEESITVGFFAMKLRESGKNYKQWIKD